MKLTSTLLLTPLLASAISISNPVTSKSHALDDKFPVPGKQPLNYCQDPKDYIMSIDFVDLDPNPPLPGQKLTIKANGTLSEDIEEGATVFLQVKYGLITLIKQEADLCDQLPKINLECPLKKGTRAIEEQVDIPRQVPPGKYTVLADVKTKDKRAITCMESVIVFSR